MTFITIQILHIAVGSLFFNVAYKFLDKDGGSSPPQKYEPEKKKDEKPEKPKFRKPAPPPMDFNQLLKLAEQKKSEPLEVVVKKVVSEAEPERPMTKKQRREYEEEMARRQRRQERMEAEKSGRKGRFIISSMQNLKALMKLALVSTATFE